MNKLKNQANRQKIIIIITLLIFSLPLALFIFLKSLSSAPAQAESFLSPLAETAEETKNAVDSSEKIYSLEYYLSLSQSFLQKATQLANNDPEQTESEKQKIIKTINEALKAASLAIQYYPNQPEAYLTRAKIYKKIKHLDPQAETAAQKDLKTANQLIKGAVKPTRAEKNNPLELIPNQKAFLAKKITIAAPGAEKTISDQTSSLNTNALSGTSTFLAHEKTMVVTVKNWFNPQANDLVYLVPKNNPENKTLYVLAKSPGLRPGQAGWFKVAIDSPSQQDISFNWWIIGK